MHWLLLYPSPPVSSRPGSPERSGVKRHATPCDAILIAGTAASGWPFAGYAALAATVSSAATFTALVDAILSGITRMRLQGFSPSIVVLPEAGFLGVMLAKSDFWRVPFSYGAVAGARRHAPCPVGYGACRESTVDRPRVLRAAGIRHYGVTFGYVADQFTKNLCTIRGETEMIPYFTDYQGAMLVTPVAV